MSVGKIMAIFVALFLALWTSKFLSDATSFIPIGEFARNVALFLLPDTNTADWLEVAIWALIIWVVICYSSVPLGFIRPRAEAFSDTKPMRYFQGFFAETSIFSISILAGLIIAVVASQIAAEQINKNRLKAIDFEISEIDSSYKNSYENGWIAGIPDDVTKAFYTKYPVKTDGTGYRLAYNGLSLSATLNYATDNNCIEIIQSNSTPSPSQASCYWSGFTIGVLKNNNYFQLTQIVQLFDERNNLLSPVSADNLIAKTRAAWNHFGQWIVAISFVLWLFIRGFLGEPGPTRFYQAFVKILDQSRFGFGGAGRFTGLIEEWGFAYGSGALFLGRSLYNPLLKIGIKDDRHMLTVAGSRGGKGISAIIPNLLLWKGSAIVIDPKGTNAAVTAQKRRDMGQTVHVIDPFDQLGEETAAFDPIGMLDPASPTIREEINLIADALVVRDRAAKDPHWDDGARTVLAGLIGHLLTAPGIRNRTLPTLREMLSRTPDEKDLLWATMAQNTAAGRLPIDAANRVMTGTGTDEIQNILSNVEKHTEWLSSPMMQSALSRSSFEFSDLKDTATTIYLVVPMQYLTVHNRFIRLFINLAIRQFIEGGRAKIPTLMMMDEFLSLGHMAEVENAMSWTAGYNLVMWPFVQDFGSFKELYGSKVNAFLTNSRAVQIFGVDDEVSNEFVSKRLGERPLAKRLDISKSNEVVPLRKPSEVPLDIASSTARQYILRTGEPAMLIERVPYFKSLFFHGKFADDPDYPGTKNMPLWKKQI